MDTPLDFNTDIPRQIPTVNQGVDSVVHEAADTGSRAAAIEHYQLPHLHHETMYAPVTTIIPKVKG